MTDRTNLRDLINRTKFQNNKERSRLNEPSLINFSNVSILNFNETVLILNIQKRAY